MKLLALSAAIIASAAYFSPPDAGSGAGVPAAAVPMTLVDAINSLDPELDSNWTADGLPDVDVIEALTGNIWVSRGDINGIPVNRDAARARVAANQAVVEVTPPATPAVPSPAPVAVVVDASTGAPVVDAGAATPPDPSVPPVDPVAAVPPAGNQSSPPPAAIDPTTAPPNSPPPAPAQPPQSITAGRIVALAFSSDAMFDSSTSGVGIVVKVADDGSANVKAFSPDGGADGFFTGVRNADDVAAMPDGADKNAALACTWAFPPRV